MLIISITGILLIMGGVSFGFWKVTDTQEKENRLISDCLKLKIEEEQDIKLENALPIKNSEGTKLKPYQVSIENVCEIEARYQVNIEVLKSEERLKSEYIRVKVNNEDSKVLEEYERSEGILENEESYKVGEGHLREKQVMRYEIRMWMDEETEATEETMNKIFKSKVTIEGEIEKTEGEYKEEILHGADPVIKEGLIPVTIDEAGTVRKADINKKWYNYANQEWANAIILEEDKTADDYQVNEQIPEADIESYFVWIPKYRYRIFNMGEYNEWETTPYESKVQPIEIQFSLDDTTDNKTECIAPASGENGTCAVNKWMTHPAFTSFDTKGIWVGKFETGYKGATNANDAQHNTIEPDKIIIKPNEYSWKGINAGKMYQNSLNYNKDLNSHMMKNTEWGAVAYLTNSIYGRCIGNECSDIRINNNSSRLTGYAAVHEPTIGMTNTNESCTLHPDFCNESGSSRKGQDGTVNYQYFNTNSVMASTTNNYTGIYDMSGGTWDRVMNIMLDRNGNPIYSKSEFSETDLTDKRYYDVYKYGIEYQYSNRILGDATGEIGPFIVERYIGTTADAVEQARPISSWNHDSGWFLLSSSPLFIRGGGIGSGFESGVFTFNRSQGEVNTANTFRITLAF